MENKIIITDEKVEVNGKVYLPESKTERDNNIKIPTDKPILSVDDFLDYINQVGYVCRSIINPHSLSDYPQLERLIKSKL